MKQKIIRTLVLAALAGGASSQASASGFALIENGASGQGNAYAGAAAIAQDASTVWFNPAGMMLLDNDRIAVAVHAVAPKASFSNSGTISGPPFSASLTGSEDDGGETAFVPNFYYVTTVSDNLKFGLGVNAPFGLGTKYDKNWVGRYHAVETELKTININPSIAFKPNEKISIGAGINLLLADVTLSSAIDFGSLLGFPEAADGFADLTGDNFGGLSYGINLGLMYEFSPQTRLGIAYRSKISVDVEGDADFTTPVGFVAPAPGVFADQGLKASVTLPDSLSVSVAHGISDLTLLADVTWMGWSSFDELRINYENTFQPDSVTTENWQNTLRFSLGADYQYSEKMTVRAGWAYDETPIPDAAHRTARIPGNSRRWLSAGFTYVMDEDLTFDLGYSHLFISDTAINNTFESSMAPLNGTLNGSYDASVDILSVQLNWKL